MRAAFTLIEILVSVVLISIVVLGVIKIQDQNIQIAHYISGRVQSELSNTLFLGKETMRYDKTEKDAYTVLHDLKVKNSKTRDILKKRKRKIHISDPLPIGELPIPIELRAVMLKSEYSARFYRIMR